MIYLFKYLFSIAAKAAENLDSFSHALKSVATQFSKQLNNIWQREKIL